MKELYNKISNDIELLNIYKNIEENELENRRWAYHNLNHIKNVINTVNKLLSTLNYDEEFINTAKIAAFMHDLGAKEGKENHAENSYLFAKDYFEKNNIKFEGLDDVLDAIRYHSAGFDTDNIIRLTLILADKLDIKSNRITELGKTIEGNRQYSHIIDIDVSIENKCLTINFITDNEIDLKELNEYYFTKKVFLAINAFSKKENLINRILMNSKDWNID